MLTEGRREAQDAAERQEMAHKGHARSTVTGGRKQTGRLVKA